LCHFSQEEFAFRCSLDRTYISDIERGKRNVSLLNLSIMANALQVPLAKLFHGLPTEPTNIDCSSQKVYKVNADFHIYCGFSVSTADIVYACLLTASQLEELPFTLFNSIDLKSLSGMVGALFSANLANKVNAIVNPIEKGHPDIIPVYGKIASEEKLRNFSEGLEIKCTVGNLKIGSKLNVGERRLPYLTGLTWQAHHQEVEQLMGLIIDFAGTSFEKKSYPIITGVFYSPNLNVSDWGEISGITGRNTKVTGMRVSGKHKMGNGWVCLLNESEYITIYESKLSFNS
jgi:transcriptional regulator with XRE-family HTH domain